MIEDFDDGAAQPEQPACEASGDKSHVTKAGVTFDEVATTGSIMGCEQEVHADTIVSAGQLGTASRLKSVMVHILRPLSSEYVWHI